MMPQAPAKARGACWGSVLQVSALCDGARHIGPEADGRAERSAYSLSGRLSRTLSSGSSRTRNAFAQSSSSQSSSPTASGEDLKHSASLSANLHPRHA